MKKRILADQLQILCQCRKDPGSTGIRKEPLPQEDTANMLDVIVPAYNVEKYVGKCLHSILNQKTRFPYRVIVVNDGSTDQTGKVIDRYQDYSLVKVIHQKNTGQSGARNNALLHTSGKYLMFVDSDDFLAPGTIEHLTTMAENEDADIVAGSYCNFRRFRWLCKKHRQKSGNLIPEQDMTGHPWGRIYRRHLFNNNQFPEKCWFEDSLMHHIVYPQAKKCLGTSQTVCFRRANPTSITHIAAGNPKSVDTVWVTLHLMKDRETLQIPFSQEYYDYLLEQIRLNHLRLRELGTEIQKAAFLVVADRILECFPGFGTQMEKNRNTEASVREMDYDRFIADIPS